MSQAKNDIHLPLDAASPEQCSALLLALEHYVSQLQQHKAKAKVSGKAESALPETTHPLLVAFLTACQVAADDLEAVESLRQALSKSLAVAPRVHITLSALPGRTLRRQLTVWFRDQIHPQTLLDFSARPDMGGGIMLQAGSHFYDHSFRQHILANSKRLGELAGV